MKQLIDIMLNELDSGRDVVLVTVVASSGSTPRGEGARMVVGKGGRLAGTIGGGSVEYESEMIASKLLRDGHSASHRFLLTPNQVSDLGMVCGGDVNVYFQHIAHNREDTPALLRKAAEALDQSLPIWLVTSIDKNDDWQMHLVDGHTGPGHLPEGLLANDSVQLEQGGIIYFAEPLVNAGTVYIFGGGHVAQELQPVLSHVGFRCVIFEDRPEFATPKLFPTAEKVLVGNFENISEKVRITENDYIVIMTRGHQFDYALERQALSTPACYIGVIGSRSKVKHISEKLLAEGFTAKDLQRIYTPIGIDIKAETPAEIAISIAAEMIRLRAELIAPAK